MLPAYANRITEHVFITRAMEHQPQRSARTAVTDQSVVLSCDVLAALFWRGPAVDHILRPYLLSEVA